MENLTEGFILSAGGITMFHLFAWVLPLFLMVQSQPILAETGKTPVIVIDPGHGGIDGGTQNTEGTVLEKDLNLAIAQKLADALKQDGLSVSLTRDMDEDLTKYAPSDRGWGRHKRDLFGRVEFARQKEATVIISLHGNHGTSKSRGAMVFYQESSPESFLLAAELQSRLNQLTQTFHSPEQGKRFYIIRKPEVPSVLVEYGYLSNSEEVARLTDERYQQLLVQTLKDGIYHFLLLYHIPR
jgi:N-acetylmuramoyl-L-alanine amidase